MPGFAHLVRLLRLPWTDTRRGLERSLEAGVPGLLQVLAGLIVGWWLYVPIHELLHAAGCAATGGTVSELEIAPLYGGGLLARVFPFVTAGGDYAGRLSGFDTGGADLVYLATVLAPYLLTVFPGVWLYRWAGGRGMGWLYGASLPMALAPFVSLPGDTYEIGSIVATWIPPWSRYLELLRGDDVFRIGEGVIGTEGGLVPWSGLILALLLGLVWAFATYGVGAGVAGRLGARFKARSEAMSSARSS